MKKNRTLRVSALLLALTLITTCFVGGTFAKYTTSAGDDVTARVANWGFEKTNEIVLDNLFSATYLKKDSTDKNSVASSDGKLVVAPGTEGSVKFKFAYDESAKTAPEVAYTFTVDTTGSNCAIPDGVLVWSLDGVQCGTSGTFAELLAAIKALSGETDGTKEYAPNTLPAGFGIDDKEYTISWVWDFDDNGAGTNDNRDTILGNADALAAVTVKIAITATQVD